MSKPSVTSLTIISAIISMSNIYCVSGLAHKICIRIKFVCFSWGLIKSAFRLTFDIFRPVWKFRKLTPSLSGLNFIIGYFLCFLLTSFIIQILLKNANNHFRKCSPKLNLILIWKYLRAETISALDENYYLRLLMEAFEYGSHAIKIEFWKFWWFIWKKYSEEYFFIWWLYVYLNWTKLSRGYRIQAQPYW